MCRQEAATALGDKPRRRVSGGQAAAEGPGASALRLGGQAADASCTHASNRCATIIAAQVRGPGFGLPGTWLRPAGQTGGGLIRGRIVRTSAAPGGGKGSTWIWIWLRSAREAWRRGPDRPRAAPPPRRLLRFRRTEIYKMPPGLDGELVIQ